ncbi:sensor histidine kinase [Spirosoma sp.]|uniref:sensor histidine kinase n=1 Tax=Spirosoma sp. TaxID=1899569 RepID=UPI00261CD777|nr:sensor histidine kinase [Spirosoma sp.]MCX6215804.1 sensor histidine kinase [Spirosoma sp.]
MSATSQAQTLKMGADVIQFRRRMAGLPAVQRLKPMFDYSRDLVEQSRFKEARPLIQMGITIARQARIPEWVARFYARSGFLEANLGNHTGAIAHYLQALLIAQSVHAYDQQQLLSFNLYAEYESLGDTAKSSHYQKLANSSVHEPNQPLIALGNYMYKSSRAHLKGQVDSVLFFERQALTMLWANRQWNNFYSILDGYGVTLALAGHYREAEQTFHRCLAYAQQQGDYRRMKYEYLHMPEPLLHLGRLNEAQHYARLALRSIEADPERQDEHRMQVYEVLTKIAGARKHYRQALTYERLRSYYADRVQNTDKIRQVAELESRFLIAQKQAHIDWLNRDNRRQLDLISWQTGGLVTLLTLLIVAGWQYRLIRRANAQLQSTNKLVSTNNQQISEQAKRQTVLMQELQHRVKNNLAIISSLLRMQSRQLDDSRAVQAVQESQRRVDAISLIHQQLYQTDNPTEVSIKAYVKELTEGLLVGYGFDPATFDYQIDVADLQLNVEVAVPLGLILNEVLTNAFKYAFLTPTLGGSQVGTRQPHPTLLVRFQPKSTGELLLEVQDNGPGLLSQEAPSRRAFSGHRLIEELTAQLDGEMSLTNRQGTYFRLLMPLPI